MTTKMSGLLGGLSRLKTLAIGTTIALAAVALSALSAYTPLQASGLATHNEANIALQAATADWSTADTGTSAASIAATLAIYKTGVGHCMAYGSPAPTIAQIAHELGMTGGTTLPEEENI